MVTVTAAATNEKGRFGDANRAARAIGSNDLKNCFADSRSVMHQNGLEAAL